MMSKLLTWVGFVAFTALGCGGNSSGGPSPPPPPPAASPQDMAAYMTPFPPMPPQVKADGGMVLANPVVVPVFFPSDALQTGAVTFLQNYLAKSVAWQTVKEYGVGKGSLAATTVLNQTLPATMTDVDLQNFIVTNVQSGALPKPDANTVYILFLPFTVIVNRGSDVSCQAFAGYHDHTTLTDGTKVPFAVIPRCNRVSLPLLTFTTSHELGEAATDPLLTSYFELADPYTLWAYNLGGSEIGDLCENLVDAAANEVGIGAVARLYSNKAAAALQNPCLPAPTGANFFSVPILTTLTAIQIGGTLHNFEEVSIPLGQSRIIEVRLLGSIVPGPKWNTSALEVPLPTAMGGIGTAALTFAWQEAPGQKQVTGQSGQTFHLQMTAATTAPLGLTTVRISATGSIAGGAQTETEWVALIDVTR